MTQISVTFQGDSWSDVLTQMSALFAHSALKPVPWSAGREVEEINSPPFHDSAPPEPAPTPALRSHKKARNASPAPTISEPEPAPTPKVPEPQPPVAAQAPAPEPEPQPERDLPSLEALKAVVTAAVRAAQKGEGSKAILDLLPAFKAKTKLDFVMNAKDEHRPALADLIESAGLALEPA